MKYIIVAVSIISLIMSACKENPIDSPVNNSIVSYNGIVNGDFEEWEIKTQGEAEFDSPSGNFWASLNTLKFLGAPETAQKTTDVYSGNFALKLEAMAWGEDWVLQGIMVAGYFDVDANIGENLIQGKPIDTLPDYFSLYYKYLPATNDTAIVVSYLTKFNEQTMKRDTVAVAQTEIREQATNYTYLELPYEINIPEIIPDTILIVLLTSISGETMNAHNGSTLYIDEVKTGFNNQ
jgi:hypothetical protein